MDTHTHLRAAYERFVNDAGLRAPSFDACHHQTLNVIIRDLAISHQLDIEELQRQYAHALSQSAPAHPMPGARKLLRSAQSLGIETAIFSNASEAYVRSHLRHIDCEASVSQVWSAMDLDLDKHAPTTYEHLARLGGVDPQEIWFADDDLRATDAASGVVKRTVRAGGQSLYDLRRELLRGWFNDHAGIIDAPHRLELVSPIELIADVQERVTHVWEKACLDRQQNLFDGDALALLSIHSGFLRVAPVKYRYVYAFLHGETEALGAAMGPLGVTGLLIRDDELLLGLRSQSTLAGSIEAVPSGTLPPQGLDDPLQILALELREEISDDWQVVPLYCGLHRHRGVYDLVYLLDASTSGSVPEPGPEHRRFTWCRIGESLPEGWRALDRVGIASDLWDENGQPNRALHLAAFQ
jgi:FMN phosphatase YigB (HAD superfamily)